LPDVFINRIATAVPAHDMHEKFVAYAPSLLADKRERLLFGRMAERAQIEHRYSCLPADKDPKALDGRGFYVRGQFPDTQARMALYEEEAPPLAFQAVERLNLSGREAEISHLIVASCTGFYAPGLDLQLISHFGLRQSVERTIVGFMGCYAAMNALKLAHHIVRSEPAAKVLVVNLELCTLHLQETPDLERVLSFLIFADGCSACVVSAEPTGIRLAGFRSTILPDSAEQITWHIGQLGFDMMLSGQVAKTLSRNLSTNHDGILAGARREDIRHWAIHPGGRSVLDAAADSLQLHNGELAQSRDVLRRYGNMSSATVMFVLQQMLDAGEPGLGCAMAFGPGITAESLLFEIGG
jgi:predicted naringenin-chalcone synthase